MKRVTVEIYPMETAEERLHFQLKFMGKMKKAITTISNKTLLT